MPGLASAATAAALLLASPAGSPAPAGPDTPDRTGAGPVVATAPAVATAPGGGALLAWSGTADAAPSRRAILGRTVGPDGAPGPVTELATAPAPTAPASAVADPYKFLGEPAPGAVAVEPALLSRGDGSFLMAYSERVPVGGHIVRTVRVKLVGVAGARSPAHPVGAPASLSGGYASGDAAPALAWGPGHRWAVVSWAQEAGTEGASRVLARRIAPDGRPLGRTLTLAGPVTPVQGVGEAIGWVDAAPTAALDGDGVLVVWRDIARTRLRGARIGAGGGVRRVALGLTARLERRALRRGLRRFGEVSPVLLARPGRHPLLAYGGDMNDEEAGEHHAAALVAAVPRPRTIAVASDRVVAYSATSIRPTAIVADPGGGATVAWADAEETSSCVTLPPWAARIDARLRRAGVPRRLVLGGEPQGPNVHAQARGDECPPPVGDPALARVRGGVLVAFPLVPYVDGRILRG